MNAGEIKTAAEYELFDGQEQLNETRFYQWLNIGYRLIQQEINNYDRQNYEVEEFTDLLAGENEIDISTDYLSINNVEFIPSGVEDKEYNRIKVPATLSDEEGDSSIVGLRWYLRENKIIFRGYDENNAIGRVYITLSAYQENLSSADDVPNFKQAFHDILVTYIQYRWFKKEQGEVNYELFLRDFYREIKDLLISERKPREKRKIKIQPIFGVQKEYRLPKRFNILSNL